MNLVLYTAYELARLDPSRSVWCGEDDDDDDD